MAVILQPNQPVNREAGDLISFLGSAESFLDIYTAQRVCITSPKPHSSQHQSLPRSETPEWQAWSLLPTLAG